MYSNGDSHPRRYMCHLEPLPPHQADLSIRGTRPAVAINAVPDIGMGIQCPLLPPPTILPTVVRQQALCIVMALHRKGISHGDVKLGNLVVDGKGKVTLIDFGSATFANEVRVAHFV